MKIAVDLHIHSALSPCSDNDMTPNNIVNMAWLKGLDAIAVTDHNSAENVSAVINLGKAKGMVVIPGMEVQSKEEVHMLCYFPELEELLDFQKLIYQNLEGKNRPEFFGEQLVMDEMDNIAAINDRLLIGSTNLTVSEVCKQTCKRGGKVIPAHIDRNTYSIISNLGFIPSDLDIATVEISSYALSAKIINKFPFLKGYRMIRSSDAHKLDSIMEREFFIEADSKNLVEIFSKL